MSDCSKALRDALARVADEARKLGEDDGLAADLVQLASNAHELLWLRDVRYAPPPAQRPAGAWVGRN